MPAQVRVGRVTLTGEVEWDYQKHETERIIRHVRGVAGIISIVAVTTKVSPHQMEANIEEAFSARPGWTPAHQCRGPRPPAKLYGHVHSTNEANTARAAAALVPGTANVESYLVVTPLTHSIVAVLASRHLCLQGRNPGSRKCA